jgi:hypothetical protein
MFAALLHEARRLGHHLVRALGCRLRAATRPSSARLAVATLADLPRSTRHLFASWYTGCRTLSLTGWGIAAV